MTFAYLWLHNASNKIKLIIFVIADLQNVELDILLDTQTFLEDQDTYNDQNAVYFIQLTWTRTHFENQHYMTFC